jgi:DNA mismatch endonuclease (patch repair protein)
MAPDAAARPGPRPAYPAASSPGRSANMRAIRRTDTKPELALRRALHRLGYRFRKDHRLDLPGRRVRPDIAFTARKVAVFVDGCFWHACPEHGSKPAVNQGYWNPKLLRNVERDQAADAALAGAGWQVVRLWEHVPLDDAVTAVVTALGGSPRPTVPPSRPVSGAGPDDHHGAA